MPGQRLDVVIALILGGAPSVWRDLAEAQALLNRRHLVVAANLAGIHFTGPLDGWASLHTDLLPKWAAERSGKPARRLFTPPTPDERWPGSSGLYALQCALLEMGATGAILCGVPMEQGAGHFSDPGAWASTVDYRRAFASALPELGARTRSMGGWTQALFGPPTAAWIDAIDNTRPLSATRAPNERNGPMHHVKNVSDEGQRFHGHDDQGLPTHFHLAPGESGDFEVNTAQAAFQTDALKVTELGTPAAKPKRVRKPGARKPRAKAGAKPAIPPAKG